MKTTGTPEFGQLTYTIWESLHEEVVRSMAEQMGEALEDVGRHE